MHVSIGTATLTCSVLYSIVQDRMKQVYDQKKIIHIKNRKITALSSEMIDTNRLYSVATPLCHMFLIFMASGHNEPRSPHC